MFGKSCNGKIMATKTLTSELFKETGVYTFNNFSICVRKVIVFANEYYNKSNKK